MSFETQGVSITICCLKEASDVGEAYTQGRLMGPRRAITQLDKSKDTMFPILNSYSSFSANSF
jgi:hypothetical protein